MPSWDVSFDLRVDFTNLELLSSLARVMAIAPVVQGIPAPPHVQERIDRLNVIRAVHGTTGIEGVDVTADEVAEIIDAPEGTHVLPDSRRREETEVRNASKARDYIQELVGAEPDVRLTEPLIKEIHRRITLGIDYPNNVPGEYRHHPATAGDYRPPASYDEIQSRMTEFIQWMQRPERVAWGPVVRALTAHFYLVSIHPFGDGNGRTSRAVESLLLYQGGINVRGFYSLANYYYTHREQYIRELDATRFERRRDFTGFVIFALKGFEAELEWVRGEVVEAARQVAYRDYARETLDSDGRSGAKVGERLHKLVMAIGFDGIKVADLVNARHPAALVYRNLSAATMRRDLERLLELELLVFDPESESLQANLKAVDQFAPSMPRRSASRRRV